MPILIASGTDAALTTLTLVDGSRTFEIQPNPSIAVQGWDFGFPSFRENVEVRTGAHGTVDTTAYFGARAVTVEMTFLDEDRLNLIDDLRWFCLPSSRPYLHVESPLWPQARRIRLRADQQTSPMTVGLGATRPLQAAWIAPDGVLEAVDATEVTVAASGLSTTGITYPVTYPVTYAPSSSGNPAAFYNEGNVPVSPVIRMYGPCSGPVIGLDGVGELSFPALSIDAGDYVEVDMRERTVLYNSSTSASRYAYLDFTTATWWQVQPGENSVRYSPASYSGAAEAVVTFRAAWL